MKDTPSGPGDWPPEHAQPEPVDAATELPDTLRLVSHLHDDASTSALLDVVRHHPGCNLDQARQHTGMPRYRFDSVLKHLLDTRRIAIHAKGQSKHVLPSVPGILECAQQIIVLRHASVPDLHVWHHQNSPCTRTALMSYAVDHLSWSESLARKRVGQMLESRLMRRIVPPVGDDQRVTWFEAVGAREPAKLVLAALAGQARFKKWTQHLCPGHR